MIFYFLQFPLNATISLFENVGSQSGPVYSDFVSSPGHHQPPLLHQPKTRKESRAPVHLHAGQLHPQILTGICVDLYYPNYLGKGYKKK